MMGAMATLTLTPNSYKTLASFPISSVLSVAAWIAFSVYLYHQYKNQFQSNVHYLEQYEHKRVLL